MKRDFAKQLSKMFISILLISMHIFNYGLCIELNDKYKSVRYSGSAGGWQIDRVSTIPSSRIRPSGFSDYDSTSPLVKTDIQQQQHHRKKNREHKNKRKSWSDRTRTDDFSKKDSIYNSPKIYWRRTDHNSDDLQTDEERSRSSMNDVLTPKYSSGIHNIRNESGGINSVPSNFVTAMYEGRTWNNIPEGDSLDFINQFSTKDPSIPENPEGLKDPSLLLGPWEETPDIRNTNAYFRGENESSVTAQVGTTANISCVVLDRGDHETVSWIRLRDHHLITVGRQTYSSDDRFTVSYNKHGNEWILHLRFVQPRDAGRYVCQLSTHPPMVFIKNLSITEASASIEGGPERIVEGGSVVKLKCTLVDHSQAPEYVFWYHNKTMINFATNRQVKVENTHDGSLLTLMSVSIRDSGNYTCVPAKAHHASVMLHVILDDAPAAMHVSNGVPTTPRRTLYTVQSLGIFVAFIIYIFPFSL